MSEAPREKANGHVLVVEDNPRLRATLRRGLIESGFVVDEAATGALALERLGRHDLDVVVLDLGLPDLDGLEILTRVRASGLEAPILVLTARDAIESRVRALDLGADDYLVKPFAFPELVARLRALQRRASAPRWGSLRYGDLQLGPDALEVNAAGRRVPLSPRERALLEMLVRRGGESCERREILREVFGYEFDPRTNLLEVHIAHLRRKLGATRAVIETVRGVGYRLTLEENDR